MIYMCCKFKQAVVEKDPLEKGIRKILNFGHTVGHSIEKLKDFKLLHGECVAIGMLQALKLSQKYAAISDDNIEEFVKLIGNFDLPLCTDGLSSVDVIKEISNDKKMASNSINFVLLGDIGHAKVKKIDLGDAKSDDYIALKDSIDCVME